MKYKKNKNHKNQITSHHLTPISRGGKTKKSNVIRLKRFKHECWHSIFGKLTIEEIVLMLLKIIKLKKGKLNYTL